MQKWARRIGLASAVGLFAAALSTTSEGLAIAHLTIVVHDGVPIPRDELRRATLDVARILGAIDVKNDWVFEEPLSSAASSPAARRSIAGLVVHAVIIGRDAGPWVSHETLVGTTLPGEQENDAEIRLFYDRIRGIAGLHHKTMSSVLAVVMAHEIGHVLLASPAHSGAGIMQTPLDQRAMDQADSHGLLFTARQGEVIRRRLKDCCENTSTR